MEKVAIISNGGIGRVAAAIPAFIEYAKTHDVIILTNGWDDVYTGAGLKALPHGYFGTREFIQDYRVINPEPYHNLEWRKGEANIVEAFYLELGLPVPEDARPYKTDTRSVGIIQKKGKLMVMQLEGTVNGILEGEARGLIDKYKGDYDIILTNKPGFDVPDGVEVQAELPLIQFIALIQAADLVVCPESCGYHLAAAANVPHIVVTAHNTGYKLYSDSQRVTRPGYEDYPIISPRM